MKFLIKMCDGLFTYGKPYNADILALSVFSTVIAFLGICTLAITPSRDILPWLIFVAIPIVVVIVSIWTFFVEWRSNIYLRHRPLWFNKYIINEKSSKYITFKNQQFENHQLQQYVMEHQSKDNYLDI